MAGNPFGGSRERDDDYLRAHVEPLLGVPLEAEPRRDLDTYLTELRAWGARLDLVAPRDQAEFLDLALADAAIVAQAEAARGAASDRIVDVGSGGGAPGIPLAIFLAALRGRSELTLLEPRAKRVTFLRNVVGRLGSVQIEVVRGRSEDLAGASFEVAISRATLPPDEWLAEGSRLATRAVWVLLARGEAPSSDAWAIDHDEPYEWPLVGHGRRALRYGPR